MTRTETIQSITLELYSFLSRRHPVCCSSDEFVYFPQAVQEETDWSSWDDLSPDSVEETVAALKLFRERLAGFPLQGVEGHHGGSRLAPLVMWVAGSLEEQFSLLRTHETQPTFTLTLATVGLVQALQNGSEEAMAERIRTLPGFFENAMESLSGIPELYRDLGVEMGRDLLRWLGSLGRDTGTGPAMAAVEGYVHRISTLRTKRDFHLSPDLLERVVSVHTGSGLSLGEALTELEEEAAITKQQLIDEAVKMGYEGDWEAAYSGIPGDTVPAGGKEELLQLEIGRLQDHCRKLGFAGLRDPSRAAFAIENLPPSLVSVRAADSYNAFPGHPFKGGVFYIFGGGSLGSDRGKVHPVYRMTAAHEAYPGHHLLDLSRWNNPQPVLRPVEYPLFYEGWACFGEDLMLETGGFDRAGDRLILLRRRFRHAVRGMTDLRLHSGQIGLGEAARDLTAAGFTISRAARTVRKYALRPAYQMCYTIGRRRFQRLFESYGQRDLAGFVNTVLLNGELLFEDLENVLKEVAGHGAKDEEKPVSE